MRNIALITHLPVLTPNGLPVTAPLAVILMSNSAKILPELKVFALGLSFPSIPFVDDVDRIPSNNLETRTGWQQPDRVLHVPAQHRVGCTAMDCIALLFLCATCEDYLWLPTEFAKIGQDEFHLVSEHRMQLVEQILLRFMGLRLPMIAMPAVDRLWNCHVHFPLPDVLIGYRTD
jgi:hypothetical protein